jgi:hypothetical protein
MSWELLVAVTVVTVFRLVWIVRRPVHRDITSYILPGLSNIRKIIKYDPNFSYVPYGLIWYAINVPIVRLGRYNGRFWMGALALIDIVFLGYSFQYMGLTVFFAYVVIGTFQLLRAPWNTSINWLIILGPISWIFLVLAPIAKFPVGLPVQVWRYTERAVGHQHNYIYFGLLGTLWLIVFNHLFLLPVIDGTLVIGLGAVWCFIFGYAYLERKARRRESGAKTSA